MQYQLVDPWGGMKQGMSDFTNTMQNIATIKQNKKRTQIMEEENERARAAHKSVMLKNQYQFVGMAYKTLDNIKDNKSYHETMKFMNNYADSLEKTSPDAAKQIRESMKKMPLYDGELYQGMEGRRKNPDSKFEAWRQQTQLGNLAMLKILGDDIKKDEVKFGTRTMTKTDGGKKKTRKVVSPEGFEESKKEGYAWGEEEAVQETPEAKGARELTEKKDLETHKASLKPPAETTDAKEAAKFKYAKQLESFKTTLPDEDKKDWGELQVADENSPLKPGTVFMEKKDGQIKIFNQDEKGTLTENEVQRSIVELSYAFDNPEKKAAELTVAFNKKRKSGMDISGAWASVLEDIYGSGSGGEGADYSILWEQ